MCTSEDGSNAACEEGAADLPHGECSAAYGDDFCAVLVTKNKVKRCVGRDWGIFQRIYIFTDYFVYQLYKTERG